MSSRLKLTVKHIAYNMKLNCSVDYYVQNGLRKIKPYWNTRSSYVKGRWLNKTIAQVLKDEFHLTELEIQTRIKNGHCQILRDNVAVDCNVDLIQNKDVYVSKQHNHEPPVLQWNEEASSSQLTNTAGIPVIYEDSKILVTNKPPGIPVHPTAYYYQNTLTEVLKNSLGYRVFPCHRLDKITSGILIFAKDQETAGKFQAEIRDKTMQKFYLARVDGEFPSTPRTSTSPLFTFEPKKSLKGAFSSVKEAETVFERIGYDRTSNQSLVLCKPLTGRTHQIRIHLARLGHPIVNDPFYNIKNTSYPKRTQFMIDYEDWNSIPAEKLEYLFNEFIDEIEMVWRGLNNNCDVCGECGEELPVDPSIKQLILYLHAWKYESDDKHFQTEYPIWAQGFLP
ncbi:HGL172Cp [Eremothecium sinecaudum]|uniref:Pseudouridine synthase n=1 Tax=Eremothecium sinecaudum TaxID=45286 RepID=A0A109V012_9SACH|nr:HGL172Cp [Eremothecium sinecaudum]AMD22168.1 HGL172Cp [Eremothecium sinecaudum]